MAVEHMIETGLTSLQVGMGHIGLQKHGFPRLQVEQVQEVNGETSDITWVLLVQLQQELPTNVVHAISGRY